MATCYSAEEAIKVIEEYLKLEGFEQYDIFEESERTVMSIPNNSILKGGEVK